MKKNEIKMAQSNDFNGLVAQLQPTYNENVIIGQSLIAQSVKVEDNMVSVSPQLLFDKLSFTHLVAILPISDPLERAFYETMAIRGTWSVRELQRQIDSNYYVRSGWSQKPDSNSMCLPRSA